MKKTAKRGISLLMAAIMLFGVVMPAGAAWAEEPLRPETPVWEDWPEVEVSGDAMTPEDPIRAELAATAAEYEIYPTPQTISYDGGTVVLPETMQAVYEAGIDSYTVDRAVEAFQAVGVTLTDSATAIKLRVGVKGSGGAVDTYFKKYAPATANLFAKNDSYQLLVNGEGVAVLGRDTDAAFYGLTTVKRVLEQVSASAKEVKCFTVEDWSDVAFRGFIEGYYGNPWSVEDRCALMEFGGELKMNIYFYAPKDDPKHNSQWRELYTDKEIETKIKPLAEAGNKSKCYYGFALHPFMHDPVSEANYDTDLADVKAKFTQVLDAGVRQIAVLADDAGVPGATEENPGGNPQVYVNLMKDLTDWVSSAEMQSKYPGLKISIPFCPNDYMGNGSSAQLQALKALPATVPVIMTGGVIWGHVSSSFVNTFYNNMGVGPYYWVNWPCSDNSKGSLTMGAHDIILERGVDPTKVQGIMLNPMQQSEPSKQAIFCNADYAWKIWTAADEEAGHLDEVWEDSFKYVDHDSALETETSEALRELSKHMIHQNANSNNNYPESVELAPTLTAFLNKMTSNTLTEADVTALQGEFRKLKDAATLYKNKTTGNTRILGKRNADGTYPDTEEQMAPWLDCWEEFATANVELLEALALSLNNNGGNDSDIVQHFLAGQNSLSASQNHSFFYVNHMESAIVGGASLVPFTNNLLNYVSTTAKTILDPTVLVETIITSRTDVADLSPLRDNDESTRITFTSPTSLSVGDYIGVKFNRSVPLTSVNFKLGDSSADGGKNTFGACKLQYTEDGIVWQDIPGEPTIVNNTMNASWSGSCRVAEIGITDLSLNVKGVRVVSTEAVNDIWIVAREIYINGKSGSTGAAPTTEFGQLTGTVMGTSGWGIYEGAESSLTDGNDGTFVWYKSGCLASGSYIGLDFGHVVKNVGRVRFVVGAGDGDKWTNYDLQYSTDGSTWTTAKSITGAASGKDVVDENLGGVEARYVRLLNTRTITNWVKFSEMAAWAEDGKAIVYQSEKVGGIVNPTGTLTDDSAVLSASSVTLKPKEFVGIALPKARRITSIAAEYAANPNIVLKAGMNEREMVEVDLSVYARRAAAPELVARYIRLENVGDKAATFVLNELSVQSVAISELHFDSSNMGETADAANWFDGDTGTAATFPAAQESGKYVIYDLGQTRSITNIQAIIHDQSANYLRHGKIQVSMDKNAADDGWTDVVVIDGGSDAEGVQNAGWANAGPNLWSKEGKIAATDARYLRVLCTGASSHQLAFNEIIINGGEYVSAENDAAFTVSPKEAKEGSAEFVPSHLVDGDYTTAFKPKEACKGSISYRFSGNTSFDQISILNDAAAAGAVVWIRTDTEGWTDVAVLGDGLTAIPIPDTIPNVLEIQINWESGQPTFYELLTVAREQAPAEQPGETGGGVTSSDVETVPINSYSGSDTTILFDENWKFNLGDASGAEAVSYNDASWSTVNLPHDFSIEQDYTSAGEGESGYLPGGTGWYRKSFTVSPQWEGKTVTIDFGGAYMDTEVYLNGNKLGEHHYGYTPFSFVLTGLNYSGENVIAVKVVNTIPSSRWYSGSGLYRSVHLTVSDKVHVARYGTKVVTPAADATSNNVPSGAVNVTTTVQNDGTSAASVTVKQEIFKLNADYTPADNAVAYHTTTTATNVSAGGTAKVEQTLNVANPDLWNSWDKGDPNLYQLKTTVLDASNKVLDTYTTEFGFRTIEFVRATGFKLNNVNVKLKGVCQHHDQGALGAEAWYRALERQVEILKDMGCNAIRVTHNPAADELIEICNRQGMLIIDEAFDTWAHPKNHNLNDFSKWFNVSIPASNKVLNGAGKTWAQLALENMVNRDKNAPCVIMYSLGNEIFEGMYTSAPAADEYKTLAENLVGWVEAIDMGRPTTFGQNGANDTEAFKVAAVLNEHGGVIGMNYGSTSRLETDFYDKGWTVYSSETVSATNSRGVYDRTNSNSDGGRGDYKLTSYDQSAVGWGATASDAWWRTVKCDYNAGEFVWTGFDYIGEPTPWNPVTSGMANDRIAKSSFFGIIDTNGIPKDSYYLYRSMWNETGKKTLHLLPTWDQEDVVISGGNVEVVVYSDAPFIKLFKNGTLVGAAKTTETATGAGHKYRVFSADTGAMPSGNTFDTTKTGHQTLYATFNVPYASGTLEVKAYDASGNEISNTVGRSVVKTTTGASKLVVTRDRDEIKNDGRDLSYITIDVTDDAGNIVNSAENEISVQVTGDGVFMGLDNGVQGDHTSYLSKTRKAGAGRLVAIVQSTEKEGSFTLTATADGLTPATVTVTTGGVTQTGDADTPASYDIAKNYYVQLNTEPEPPETATVTMGDGSKRTNLPITWQLDYDKALLGTVGSSFAITGVIDQGTEAGKLNIPVSVSVTVLDQVAALLNYSAAVRPGEAVNLPASRPAVMADGTVLTAQFGVTWEEHPDSYSKVGSYTVHGTAEVFGSEMNVTATIRVSAEKIIVGGDMMNVARPLSPNTEAEVNKLRDDNAVTTVSVSAGNSIAMDFATAQAFYKVVVQYKDNVPSAAPTIALGNNTSEFTTVTPAKTTVDGATVTYELPEILSRIAVKLTFSENTEIAKIQLITATSTFPISSTAALDGMTVGGREAAQDQLAAGQVSSPAAAADVVPVTGSNVASTILPRVGDKILVVTESEDHSDRALYTVLLNQKDIAGANDGSFDYPFSKTTATAPSAHNSASDGPNDGPADWAVDGRENTYWHSAWSTTTPAHGPTNLSGEPEKRYLQLELEEATEINGLRYLGRNDNGFATSYEVWVSTEETVTEGSKTGFTKVAEGSWTKSADWNLTKFSPVNAKYVRLYGVSTYGDSNRNNQFMSCRELRVIVPSTGADLSTAVVTVAQPEQMWTGAAVTPAVTVTLKGETLTKGVDYTLRYENNVNEGTATVYASGTGNYYGTAQGFFTIEKSTATVASIPEVEVTVHEGAEPVLPETVTALMSDGGEANLPVEWTGTGNTRTGTVAGTDQTAALTVTVANAASIDTVSAVTAVNQQPTLPKTVTVRFADGESEERSVSWDTVNVSAAATVTVEGDVTGITSKRATASVRVGELEQSNTDFALNTNSTANIFPFAIAYWSSGDNNPYAALDGNTAHTSRWSDWERGISHADPKPWMGVVFSPVGEVPTVRSASEQVTLKKYTVNKVELMFCDEGNGTQGSVTYPTAYEVQYYTGDVNDLTLDTTLNTAAEHDGAGNGRVKNWPTSPLNTDNNWQTVSYAANGHPNVSETSGTTLTVNFADVETAMIRVLCTPKTGKWVGISDLKVYGKDVPAANTDFTLTEVKVGETTATFDANKVYSHPQLNATEPFPTVTATASHNARIAISPATEENPNTVITVTSEDGKTKTETYTVRFSRDPYSDFTPTITVNGVAQTFTDAGSNQYTASYSVPAGGSTPVVRASATNRATVGEVTYTADAATVTITSEDGNKSVTYTVNFEKAKFDTFDVTAIYVGGVNQLAKFGSGTTLDATVAPGGRVPTVSATATNNAKVAVTQAGAVPGSATVTITPEDATATGNVKTYTVNFHETAAAQLTLSSVTVGGQEVDFGGSYTYTHSLPAGTTEAPEVAATSTNAQKVDVIQAGSPTGKAVITLTAANGVSRRTYTVSFAVAKYDNFGGQSILVDGEERIRDFKNGELSITVGPAGSLPTVTASANHKAIVTVSKLDAAPGDMTITMTSEDGSSQAETYTIHFDREKYTSFTVNTISVDGGVNLVGQFVNGEYTMRLEAGAEAPIVTVSASNRAKVTVEQAKHLPGSALITVLSEDGRGQREDYTVHFITPHAIHLAGGNGVALSSETAFVGETVTLSQKNGYRLVSWEVTADTGEEVSITGNSFVMPNCDVTLTISAPVIPYKLSYDLQGGKLSKRNPETYNVESGEITLNDPTKSGYTFKGWTGGGLTIPTMGVTIPAGSTGDRAYTANWTKNGGAGEPIIPGGGGGGGGGGRPTTGSDETGAVTTTVTDPRTGAVTETVSYPDGAQSVTVTQADGSSTRTVTHADGSRSVASTVPGEGTTIVVTDEIGEEVAHVTLPEVSPEEEKTFRDVPKDHWAAQSIGKVAAMGLFVGDENGNFRGNERMNRGMMATVLHRISGELKKRPAEFVDVSVGAYYAGAVDWASAAGIIKGVGDNRYAPNQDITRQELATMMYRYAKFLGVDTRVASSDVLAAFPDGGSVGGWATEAMTWAVSAGLFQGRGAELAPQGNATRAEVATILSRFVELLK